MKLLSSKRIFSQYLGIALAWGSSFYLIKLALEDFSPTEVTFLRSFIGFLILLAWCQARSIHIPRPSKLWIHLGVLSVLLNTAPSFLFAYAETHVSSTLAGLINATTPLFTLLIVTVFIRSESIVLRQILGIVLGFVGICLLIGFNDGLTGSSPAAILALFIAIFCFSISYPYIKTFLSSWQESSEGMIVIQLGLSSLWISPFLFLGNNLPTKFSHTSVLAILGLGAFASGFAYVWNIEVTKYLGSALASTVSYLIPVVSSFTGLIFLGESISAIQLAGGFLILGAVWISQRVTE